MNPASTVKAAAVRRTKIVATVGPAIEAEETIRRLIRAGVNAFRLNFSHSGADWHEARTAAIRRIAAEEGVAVCLLQDLQGPKIRIETFKDPKGIRLKKGLPFRLTVSDAPGDETRVGLTHPELVNAVAAGQRLLLKDGRIELTVLSVDADGISTEVVTGGTLSDHAGINAPAADLAIPALTEKDVEDLELGARLGVDWVALSFVRSREDLATARAHLRRLGAETTKLMAKIEKPAAVFRFDEILAVSDGIMIARGDLGVEMRPEDVPIVQKRVIRACVEAGKPVITATQMLDSMVSSPSPTRAEASDVANAIFDGTDAVMLSNETAVGEYPLEAVQMMDRIAREVESSPDYQEKLSKTQIHEEPETSDAVAHSACHISEILKARAVACFTSTGSTVWRIARYRPRALIVALTPKPLTARQLALGWGILAIPTPDPTGLDQLAGEAVARLRAAGIVAAGDRVVITAGVPLGRPGTTNLLRVEEVK